MWGAIFRVAGDGLAAGRGLARAAGLLAVVLLLLHKKRGLSSVLVSRRDAPEFAAPAEGVRWLDGKRFAVSPGTCQERVAFAAGRSARARRSRAAVAWKGIR